MMATHFTAQERGQLSAWLQMKMPKAEIARRLGRHPSTIFRELKRNTRPPRYSDRPSYNAVMAQQLADHRRRQKRVRKLQRPEIRDYVTQRLRQYWSPDEIAGRMRLEFADARQRVSHQAIYDWLARFDHARPLLRFLRGFRRRKRRPRSVQAAAMIAHRPQVIENRERVGDWEGDTIVGARRSGALVSMVERKTGYVLLAKVKQLASERVDHAMRRRLRRLPASHRRSMTLDNGSEFVRYARLKKSLGMDVYFAQPRCPWQRGTNENTNGLVRQFLPKGTSFRDLSPTAVARIQSLLNERPRKRLGYMTPNEAFKNASHAMLC